ncbi:hypothetical protein GCM10012290_03370 [Halolactibacillus alkaliphilus]|uniref:Uncharacterized protein n=1 Tax=Halolactibacillus alkaliphilus TaxID=442899 RepID=A0A511WYR1_9BACI|nr:DUF1128 family protein [Halolactibacillus alkaliphilus]GEN55751.1 hypothetical protein HAL01_02150 [Halolactibacillus alkaliphilus]GGN65117.1 hypothetical protein GCM10012290_03370 [Halolactibacillus alkaliphilus]SFO64299.1 Uncharacterized protein YfkK, UPF0435 family [Halolactibacillus alkaliphilus]
MTNDEHLTVLLNTLKAKINVVNDGLFNPEDFNPDKVKELEELVNFIKMRSHLSLQENEAVIAELKTLRK